MNSSESDLILQAIEKLNQGFYLNNLRYLADRFREMSLSTKWVTPSFVLLSVAQTVLYDWDERPVTTVEAEHVSAQLRPRFGEVLELMRKNRNIEEVCASLDRLVLSLLTLSDQ